MSLLSKMNNALYGKEKKWIKLYVGDEERLNLLSCKVLRKI